MSIAESSAELLRDGRDHGGAVVGVGGDCERAEQEVEVRRELCRHRVLAQVGVDRVAGRDRRGRLLVERLLEDGHVHVAQPLHVLDRHALRDQRLLHARYLGRAHAHDERVELRLHLFDRHAVVQLVDDGLQRLLARGGDLGVDRLGWGAGGLLGDDLVSRDLGADVVEHLIGVDARHLRGGLDLGDARHRREQRRVLERVEVRVVAHEPVEQVRIRVDEVVDGGGGGDVHGRSSRIPERTHFTVYPERGAE